MMLRSHSAEGEIGELLWELATAKNPLIWLELNEKVAVTFHPT